MRRLGKAAVGIDKPRLTLNVSVSTGWWWWWWWLERDSLGPVWSNTFGASSFEFMIPLGEQGRHGATRDVDITYHCKVKQDAGTPVQRGLVLDDYQK